jgi:pimeloyl-ACP methyl ester carboxylesterase
MGTSVTTEFVARYVNKLLPAFFSDGFKSFTFTNGSMVMALSKLRLAQKLLLSKNGKRFSKFSTYYMFKHQVRSAHGNNNLSDAEIELMWEFNCLKDGHLKNYLTIKYLLDRKKFEKTRWLPALAKCDIPIHLCWGDDDQVARITMVHYLKQNICTNAHVTTMKGLGHFCQMDKPDKWVEYVSAFYKQSIFK